MRFRHLPKAELHCHIDGIVDPAMLRSIERQGIRLPATARALRRAYPVRNIEEFIRWFHVADALEEDPENFKPVLAQHIRRLKQQHVVYAEIMLGTSELPRDDGAVVERFATFREYVTILEEGRIQIEFLVALARGRPPEWAEAVAHRLIALRKADLLFGVAVAGWPETPVEPLGPVLARLRDAGLGIEVHAGEWSGPESVWDALEHARPHRIGHGVAVFRDPRLLERVQRDGIHIEMCPTSNVKTGSVPGIAAHPVGRARELGVDFSINTDDPGPFECSLESEFELLAGAFGFGDQDFLAVLRNALNARFQPTLRYPHLALDVQAGPAQEDHHG